MIEVTKQAAEQIKKAAEQSASQGMALRVAVKINEDGSYEYGMGFDEPKENDITVVSEGVKFVVSLSCSELLEEAKLDFVELEGGASEFIFFNPNDPNHKQPKESDPKS